MLEEGKTIKKAIEYMNDKAKYIQDIYDKKKEVNVRIREIEQMMLDKKYLKKEKYEEVNKTLPLDKQIFSVNRFLSLIKARKRNII